MNIFPIITYTLIKERLQTRTYDKVTNSLEVISGTLPERIITERLGILMKVLFHQQPCIPAETDSIIDDPKLTLQEELAKSRFALEIAYSNFDNVTDPDLIDCYIYEVNAVMKRYKYLLEKAAETDALTENKQGEAYRALSLFS